MRKYKYSRQYIYEKVFKNDNWTSFDLPMLRDFSMGLMRLLMQKKQSKDNK